MMYNCPNVFISERRMLTEWLYVNLIQLLWNLWHLLCLTRLDPHKEKINCRGDWTWARWQYSTGQTDEEGGGDQKIMLMTTTVTIMAMMTRTTTIMMMMMMMMRRRRRRRRRILKKTMHSWIIQIGPRQFDSVGTKVNIGNPGKKPPVRTPPLPRQRYIMLELALTLSSSWGQCSSGWWFWSWKSCLYVLVHGVCCVSEYYWICIFMQWKALPTPHL